MNNILNEKKLYKILNLTKQYNPILNTYNIEIKKGKQWQVCYNTKNRNTELGSNNFKINYNHEQLKDNFKDNLEKYLYENLDEYSNIILFDYMIEVFALLHEIGHITTIDVCFKKSSKTQYNKFKKTCFSNSFEHFVAYRKLDKEIVADKFGLDFLDKHYSEITEILLED